MSPGIIPFTLSLAEGPEAANLNSSESVMASQQTPTGLTDPNHWDYCHDD